MFSQMLNELIFVFISESKFKFSSPNPHSLNRGRIAINITYPEASFIRKRNIKRQLFVLTFIREEK